MIPNLPDYKVIKVASKNPLKVHIKTTYTNPEWSFFSVNDSDVQKYPIVSKINDKCEAYDKGLRVGHKIIKLNDYSLEYKDIKTVLSDFTYERKNSDFITLTIL